jgi:hypothetical protein
MFAKLTDIISGKNWHVNDLYEQVTRMVAPGLPNDPQVTTMFFVLQRGVDRLIYANGGTPLLNVNVKQLQPTTIIQLMDFYSGVLRRAAQMRLVSDFELLDQLAHKIFPHTAANSLELFDSESHLMQAGPIEWRMFGPSWEWLAMAFIGGSYNLITRVSLPAQSPTHQYSIDASLNKPQLAAFLSDGVSLLQSDVDVIVRGDPMGVAM